MSAIDDVLASIPMDQLAAQLGVDPATAEQAARTALPALLGGMEANAQDPAGAQSLASAIDGHDAQLVEGGVDLGQVDAGTRSSATCSAPTAARSSSAWARRAAATAR